MSRRVTGTSSRISLAERIAFGPTPA
jgi:hypothetical protein